MIFATVGSQEPFDRLIRAIDEWAEVRARSDVFAQIAGTTYRPSHIQFTDFMPPEEFERSVRGACVVVAHAGIGSILSALGAGKPIVIMPRRACFRETRNDHQVATAEHFGQPGRVIVARDEQDLARKLDHAVTLSPGHRIKAKASPRLLGTIRSFLEGAPFQPSPPLSTDEVGCNSDDLRMIENMEGTD